MLIDWLLEGLITVLKGLCDLLPYTLAEFVPSSPYGSTGSSWIPQGFLDAAGLVLFYIDITPLAFFFQLLFSMFAGFIAYKIINLIFNLVADIL